MDNRGAKRLAESLLTSAVGGWKILRAINHGKSAVVFEARRGKKRAALKVFDPELIVEYGRSKQLDRVRREQTLRGHRHPHLVKILDGGECPTTKHVFIVMEHIAYPNLASVRAAVPDSQIATIISQVASAAKYLHRRGFVHRDIKPENIVIDETFSHAVLLDLGVIRPVRGSALTDGTAGKEFIATLRYSSPTYLFRDDDGTPDSLQALTYYQLGGVLHDLVMKTELFSEHSKPWTRLVRAIEQENPKIERDGVNPRLCSNVRIPKDMYVALHQSDRESRVEAFEALSQLLDTAKCSSQIREFLVGYAASRIAPGTFEHLQLLRTPGDGNRASPYWYAIAASTHDRGDMWNLGGSLARRLRRQLLTAPTWREPSLADVAIDELIVTRRMPALLEAMVIAHVNELWVELLPGVVTVTRWPTRSETGRAGEQPQQLKLPSMVDEERATSIREAEEILVKIEGLLSQYRSRPDTTKFTFTKPKRGRRSRQ